MKASLTLEVAAHAAQLVQHCATFQALYGRYYNLKPGSSQEAWALYDAILAEQVAIAQRLDPQAVENPHQTYESWWERQDIMDLSLAKTLMQQVAHLIATTAYFEAEPHDNEWSYAIYCAESTVSGLLHPAARQMALASLVIESARHVS